MKFCKLPFTALLACVAIAGVSSSVRAFTDVQVGTSGKTYAAAAMQCALHPVRGMAPMVQAGLYNPKRTAKATVSLNGDVLATVTFLSPDTNVWLANGANTLSVAPNRRTVDNYSFDATLTYPGQPNACIPDTRGNAISGELEHATSYKSSVTVTPGCAFNPLTGRGQPFVNLFDDGNYLLNISVNNVPLTQLNGTTRRHTPVFLSAGLNVIMAANAAVSIDYFVRDGGDGNCVLP